MMTPRTSRPATLGPLGSGSSAPSLTPKDDKGKNRTEFFYHQQQVKPDFSLETNF